MDDHDGRASGQPRVVEIPVRPASPEPDGADLTDGWDDDGRSRWRLDPGDAGVVAVLVVVVLAVLLGVGLVLRPERADDELLPVVRTGAAAASEPGAAVSAGEVGGAVGAGPVGPAAGPAPGPVAGPAGAGGPSGAGAPSPSTPPEVVVAVAGEVVRPGLVRLPPGSRVADALAAAGGVAPGAEVGLLNLARPLADGELVVVGPEPQVLAGQAGAGGEAGPPPGAGATAGAPGAGGPLSLSTADASALETLPGIGPVLAQRVVEHRERHGPFGSVDALLEVSGVGPATLERLRDHVVP